MGKSNKRPSIISQDINVLYTSPEAGATFFLRKADFNRWKSRLHDIRPEAKLVRIGYAVCFGIAGTAGFSIFPLEGKPPWALSAHICVALATFTLAVILLLHDKQDTKSSTGDIESVIKDMEEIEASFVTEEQAGSQIEGLFTFRRATGLAEHTGEVQPEDRYL